MADGTQITAGSGTTIATDDTTLGHHQKIKIVDGTTDSTIAIPGDATNGLDVDVTRVQGTVTVAGNATVSGTVTSNIGTTNGLALDATLTGGTQKTKLVDTGGTNVASIDASGRLAVDASGTTQNVQDTQVIQDNSAFTDGTSKVFMAGHIFDEVAGTALTENDAAASRIDSKRAQVQVIEDATTRGQRLSVSAAGAAKVDGSAVTQPVSGTVTANVGTTNGLALDATLTGGTQKTKIVDSGGTTVATVTAANALKVDGSAVTQPVSGTVTANIGTAGTLALDATLTGGTQKTKIVDSGGTTVATVTAANALKVDGSAVTQPVSGTITGITNVVHVDDNAGSLTVDGTVAATQSGTWTVQPGNTANTTPWLTTQTPATSGGLSTSHTVSAASTNATNVKASAGQLFGWYIYNSNAAARKVAFHNTAGTPTAGASVFFSVVIPPSSAANVEFTNGIAFGTGIAFTTVTGLADSDSTAVAANDLIVNLFYK